MLKSKAVKEDEETNIAIKSLTPFLMFGCWMLSNLTSLLSSSTLDLDKLMRRPSAPSFGPTGSSKHSSSPTRTRHPIPVLCSYHNKTWVGWSLSWALWSHFWICLGPCPVLPPNLHYVSSKPVHILLVHVWPHPSGHLNQILGMGSIWAGKVTIPDINRDCGQRRPFLGGDMDGLGSEPCKYLGEHSVGGNWELWCIKGKTRRLVRLEWGEQGVECVLGGECGVRGGSSRGAGHIELCSPCLGNLDFFSK